MANEMEQAVSGATTLYSQGEAAYGHFAMQALVFFLGITLYAIFCGSFYWKLSRREIFKFRLPDGKSPKSAIIIESFAFAIKYTLLFPLITLIWTVSLVIFIAAVSKNIGVESIAVISIAIVAATRVCAYYNQEIAIDLAKMFPLALLAIALADPAALSPQTIIGRISSASSLANDFLAVFLALVVLEWALRISVGLKHRFLGGKKQEGGDMELDLIAKRYAQAKKQRAK